MDLSSHLAACESSGGGGGRVEARFVEEGKHTKDDVDNAPNQRVRDPLQVR